MLNDDYYAFARQCGATDVVVHLCDYGVKTNAAGEKVNQPVGDHRGWGVADHPGLWSLDEVTRIRDELHAHDLNLFAIENFDPAQWHDILLAGPRRAEQIEQAKEQIRIFAEAGVEVFGYNFSLTGVTGRVNLSTRGGATSVGLDGMTDELEAPLPRSMVWNMEYDSSAQGFHEPVSEEDLWDRVSVFLNELLPVAEECGIRLAAHPDDPPLPRVHQQPKLVYRYDHYQKLLDLNPSPSNALEMCVGTLSEMDDDDLYGCVERYARQKSIGYVHLRNVVGKVPHYRETFIDDGDVDVRRVLQILADSGFDGVIIPDHAPQMTCSAPWHAGMAFAMGYLRAMMQDLEGGSE
jgi:mannonate dehydratase